MINKNLVWNKPCTSTSGRLSSIISWRLSKLSLDNNLDCPCSIMTQKITRRHKKRCYSCGNLPSNKRILVIYREHGRYDKFISRVYCSECAKTYLHTFERTFCEKIEKIKKELP